MKTILFLAQLFIVASGNASVGTPLASVGVPAALLAEVGSASNAEVGSWVMVMFAIGSGVGGICGLIALFRPQPALHKQFSDKEDTDKKLDALTDAMAEMRKEFTAWSADHYRARGRMHRKIERVANAMSYLAGTIEGHDAKTAARIHDLLNTAIAEEEPE